MDFIFHNSNIVHEYIFLHGKEYINEILNH